MLKYIELQGAMSLLNQGYCPRARMLLLTVVEGHRRGRSLVEKNWVTRKEAEKRRRGRGRGERGVEEEEEEQEIAG